MRQITSILILALMAVLVRTAAGVTVRAELACPDAARTGRWETLKVSVSDLSDLPADFHVQRIAVRDARGGPSFSRPVEMAAGNAASFPPLLMPLSMLAAAELPLDRWPVEITLAENNGREIRRHVDVVHPASTGVGESSRFAVVTPADQTGDTDQAIAMEILSHGRQAEVMPINLEDLLHAPSLVFASCDALLMEAAVAEKLNEPRVLALVNAGLRLVVHCDRAPGGGLSRLVWDRLSSADTPGGTWWVSPRETIGAPQVLEPGLQAARGLDVHPQMGTGLKRLLLSIIPVAMGLAILLRILVHRSSMVLGILTSAIVVWTCVSLALVKTVTPASVRQVGWTVSHAPRASSETPGGADGGSLEVREIFKASVSLVARHWTVAAGPEEMLLAVAVSPRQYFAIEHVTLDLGNPAAPDGGQQHLSFEVPGRESVVYGRREVREIGNIPPFPRTPEELARWTATNGMDLKSGAWLEGGYVVDPGKEPQIFSAWADRHPLDWPTLQPEAAKCWYEMRFDGQRRYFLRKLPAGSAKDTGLALIDFGESEPAATEAK